MFDFLCLLVTGMQSTSYTAFQSVGCCSICDPSKVKALTVGFSHLESFWGGFAVMFFFPDLTLRNVTCNTVCAVLPLSV